MVEQTKETFPAKFILVTPPAHSAALKSMRNCANQFLGDNEATNSLKREGTGKKSERKWKEMGKYYETKRWSKVVESTW